MIFMVKEVFVMHFNFNLLKGETPMLVREMRPHEVLAFAKTMETLWPYLVGLFLLIVFLPLIVPLIMHILGFTDDERKKRKEHETCSTICQSLAFPSFFPLFLPLFPTVEVEATGFLAKWHVCPTFSVSFPHFLNNPE